MNKEADFSRDETTYFPQVGGKGKPWRVVTDDNIAVDRDGVASVKTSHEIFSGVKESSMKGFLDEDGRLHVYDSFFKPLQSRETDNFFDNNSYESVLQAVRLCFLLTQETEAERKSRQTQNKILNCMLQNDIRRLRR